MKTGEMLKDKTVKAILISILIIVVAFVFTGCGSSTSSKSSEKTYTAITESTFAPFDTTNKDGEIVGFDMDLLNAIGKDQNFKVKYKSMEFDSLVPAIESNNADIIAAAMTVTKDRAKKVAFSNSYYSGGVVVVVKNNNTTIKSVDDLTTSMTVGAQAGTTSGDKATSLYKSGKIKKAELLDGNDKLFLQVQNGDIEVMLIDRVAAEQYVSNKGKGKVKIVGNVLDAEDTAFAVNKDNKSLLEKINKGLKNVIKDGTYSKLCKKWGIEDKSDK